MRIRSAGLLALSSFVLLPGCASTRAGSPSLSACRAEVAQGVLGGLLVGMLSAGRGSSNSERAARGAVGGMAGGALGYNACVQAHRQRYALEQRFAALEARLQAAQSNGGLVQTSATNNRGVFVRTAVHRSEETYSTLVTVSGPQLFAPARAELLPESFDYLQQISDNLADQPTTRVVVMGHVDPSETESGGQALSQARADAVMAFLVRQGINPARMSAHGLGTSRLADPSGRTDAPLRNRRVEVALMPTDTGDAETGSASKSIKS